MLLMPALHHHKLLKLLLLVDRIVIQGHIMLTASYAIDTIVLGVVLVESLL